MPLDTILLLDTSGSMAGRGMRELQRACHVFLDGVEETARQTGLKVSELYSAHARILGHARMQSCCKLLHRTRRAKNAAVKTLKSV